MRIGATAYTGARHPRTHSRVKVLCVDDAMCESWPLPHFVKHSPAGFEWGYTGSGPADLARSLLIDALGPWSSCGTCGGSSAVVWPVLGSGDPEAFDPRRAKVYDPNLIGRCPCCDDGVRRLPYHEFKAAIVAHLGDHWRLTRGEILAWLAGEYEGEVPPWLHGALDDAEVST